MALKPLLLLSLWGLILFVHEVTSLCNVTCSTDYSQSLNCSCSPSVPTSVLIQVKCRDEDLEVADSCKVEPPQSWCIMRPEMFKDIASFGTTCTSTVSLEDSRVIMTASESSSWALSDVVKPLPPFDVKVTTTEGFYNITWNHDNSLDCLTYRVCIRESKDLSKDPIELPLVEEKEILFNHEQLQPNVNYSVAVKAKMCPGVLYEGPWSEWSSTAKWTTTGTETEDTRGMDLPMWNQGFKGSFVYIPLSILFVIGLLVLAYLHKPYLKRRLQVITYVPKPDEFFKPLYQNYGGNFKEWVKPVFNEYDFLKINSQVQMKNEKQHDVLQWNNEKQSYREDNEVKQGDQLLHMLQPHSNSLLFIQDGGSSQVTGHSTGHISIHTVTLSGEEEFEEDAVSESSVNTLRSYQDGESFGSFGEDNREQVGYNLEEPQMAMLDRQNWVLLRHENQISDDLSLENINFQPHIQLDEPERVSLDSFASNEQSEDGYPHVDLDTIDSGFGECSSPGASDSNIAEQIDPIQEHKSSNSNYVKQWMACSTIQED